MGEILKQLKKSYRCSYIIKYVMGSIWQLPQKCINDKLNVINRCFLLKKKIWLLTRKKTAETVKKINNNQTFIFLVSHGEL
jgi:hypothetical protein